jgi:DNA-binding transcriptional LysR family regulator
LDLRHLQIFCKVVDLKSFSKAGDAVYLSQPTVSGHIQSLEEDLGIRLLDRLGKEVVPTKAGKILYGYAKRLLALRDEAVQSLESFQGIIRGDLTVGGSTIPGEYLLPILIGQFKKKYEDVRVTLVIGDTKKIINEVLEGGVEVGAVGARIDDERLHFETFVRDEMVLAVPPQHLWTNKTEINIDDLLKEPFIAREPGSGTRMATERVLRQKGVDIDNLKIIAEMGSTEAVRQGIKAGIGVSILSKKAISEELRFGILKEVKIRDLTLLRNFYLVNHKRRTKSPLCHTFIDFLLKKREHPEEM